MDIFWMIVSIIVGIALFGWIGYLFAAYVNTAIIFVIKLITKKEYAGLESRYFKILQIPLIIVMAFAVIWFISH